MQLIKGKYNMRKMMIIILGVLILTACKPDMANFEIYTSDVVLAQTEVVEISAQFKFGILSDDDDGTLEKVVETAKKFLPADSEFSISNKDFGQTLFVETTIPMGTKDIIEDYVSKNKSVLYVQIGKAGQIKILESAYLSQLSDEISDLNLMLSVKFPGGENVVRVVNDLSKKQSVSAYAVFVLGKPYYFFNKNIKKRGSVEINFPGGDGSIYSELSPLFSINQTDE
jgi:hypothetical protein